MIAAVFARSLADVVPVLVAALTLLLVVRGAARRQPAPRNDPAPSRGANAELRALVARGASVTAIARDARVPHDVATLAVHLEQRRSLARRPRRA